MNCMHKSLDVITRILDDATKVSTAFLFCWMLAVVLVGVFFRYFLGSPISWSEEIPRYIMVWIAFPASAMALRRNQHMGVALFVQHLPRTVRKGVRFVSNLFVLVFLFVAAKHGYLLAQMVGGDQRTPMANIPMAWLYYSIPVGCVLMIVQLMRSMVIDLRNE